MGLFGLSEADKMCRCGNCGHVLDFTEMLASPTCPKCGKTQSLERRVTMMRVKTVGSDIKDVYYTKSTCQSCGCNDAFVLILGSLYIIRCAKCNELIDTVKTPPYRHSLGTPPPGSYSPECPFCHSRRTRKRSKTAKAAFLILSLGSYRKQWHCDNCGINF